MTQIPFLPVHELVRRITVALNSIFQYVYQCTIVSILQS